MSDTITPSAGELKDSIIYAVEFRKNDAGYRLDKLLSTLCHRCEGKTAEEWHKLTQHNAQTAMDWRKRAKAAEARVKELEYQRDQAIADKNLAEKAEVELEAKLAAVEAQRDGLAEYIASIHPPLKLGSTSISPSFEYDIARAKAMREVCEAATIVCKCSELQHQCEQCLSPLSAALANLEQR